MAMTRTLVASLVLACALVACHDDDDTPITAEPQQAEEYSSVGVLYGESWGGLVCDAFIEGQAFCADDTTFVYCSLGEWWVLDCVEDLGADFCGEDDYEDTVDCYEWI
jgi:hypothetical protein